MTGFRIGQPHLNGHLFKLELVNSPECESCKQTSETASHVLWDCEVLATLRFRHLGFFSRILHFVQSAGLLDARMWWLHRGSSVVEVQVSLICPHFPHSITFQEFFVGSCM